MKRHVNHHLLLALGRIAGVILVELGGHIGHANPLRPEVHALVANLQPPQVPVGAQTPAVGLARYRLSVNGDLTYVAAAPSQRLQGAPLGGGAPEKTARDFLKQHAPAFGAGSPAADFVHLRTKRRQDRHFACLGQTLAGVPVFAAQVTVQVDDQGAIQCVFSDIARDATLIDKGLLLTVPTLSPQEAVERARALFAAKVPPDKLRVTIPRLEIFAPEVLGAHGPLQLIWEINVSSEDFHRVNEQVLLDAHNGKTVRRYPLNRYHENRKVFDANYTSSDPGTLRRSEGQGSTGDQVVDNAYDYLGDAYAFFAFRFSRDGISPVVGDQSATVKFCEPDFCPCWYNAQWNPATMRMYFGTNYVTDDIVGHEYMHGITGFEGPLIYANASGAIQESLSDVFGEFIDLTNTHGNDDPTNRWLHGEDTGWANRSMKDPPLRHDPDSLGSPYYRTPVAEPTEENDWGGVHSNSGINNKLCYLLTDGDSFNGWTVTGMGINRVDDLFYEALGLVSPAVDWDEWDDTLIQAAVNLGWSESELSNLNRACHAIEIRADFMYVDSNSLCPLSDGTETCDPIDWFGPYKTVADGVNNAIAGGVLVIDAGPYKEPGGIRITKRLKIIPRGGPVTIW